MEYRFATMEDLEELVNQRLSFIKVTPQHPQHGQIRENCRAFFKNGFEQNTCQVILAGEDGKHAGCAVIFYYASLPSARNPAGTNAYITSVYVEPTFRRRGIATEMMRRLTNEALGRGCVNIMLTATEAGAQVYEKIGYIKTTGGMIYQPSKE